MRRSRRRWVEWSARETAGGTAALTQRNLEDETEENRGLVAEGIRGLTAGGNRGLAAARGPTAEGNRGLILARVRSRRIVGGGHPRASGHAGQGRANHEARWHAKAAPGTERSDFVAGLPRVHQLGACWMVPVVDNSSFVHHRLVAPSPEAQTKVCQWCACKVATRESDESDFFVVHHLERFLERARRCSRVWNEMLMFGRPKKHDHRHFFVWSPLEPWISSFLQLSRGDQ